MFFMQICLALSAKLVCMACAINTDPFILKAPIFCYNTLSVYQEKECLILIKRLKEELLIGTTPHEPLIMKCK